MVKWAFMTDPVTNNIGLYDEPVASGAYDDPNSARNAPLNDPEGFLAQVYWHIQFDNMEVFSDNVVTINHAAVASGGTGGGGMSANSGFDYSGPLVNWDAKTHGLGYEPMAYVAVGNNLITPGYIVQIGAGFGAARYVSVHVSTTKVFIREYSSRGSAGLSAASINYRVIVLAKQPPAEGNVPPKLIDFNEASGLTKFGDGRWSADRRYMQVVPGGSPFGLALGRTLDLKNGAVRFVAPDGTIYDPVPATLKTGIGATSFPAVFGNSMAYNGTFAGDEVLLVQAP